MRPITTTKPDVISGFLIIDFDKTITCFVKLQIYYGVSISYICRARQGCKNINILSSNVDRISFISVKGLKCSSAVSDHLRVKHFIMGKKMCFHGFSFHLGMKINDAAWKISPLNRIVKTNTTGQSINESEPSKVLSNNSVYVCNQDDFRSNKIILT